MKKRRWSTVLAVLGIMTVTSASVAAAAPPYIFWSNDLDSVIGRSTLDGSGQIPSLMPATFTPMSTAANSTHVFWTRTGGNTIGRGNLDGTGANQSFITLDGGSGPFAVALSATHIYWTSLLSHKVGRAKLDGTEVIQNFISTSVGPGGIAVDDHHVYWTEPSSHRIGRANLDASGVNESFVSLVTNPYGLTATRDYLYWANYTSQNSIGRSKIDGSDVSPVFLAGSNAPYSVTTSGNSLYWSNSGNNTIGRANLDGSGVNQGLVSGLTRVRGVSALPLDQSVAKHCVKASGKLPKRGSKTLMRSSCKTNLGNRIAIKRSNKKVAFGCKVRGKTKKTKAASSAYGSGYRYCSKGELLIRTSGKKGSVTITWGAPEILGRYSPYLKTHKFTLRRG